MLLGTGVRPACLGVALGGLVAAGLSRTTESLLHDVAAVDVGTYLTLAAVMVVVSAVASFLPARRAAGANSVTALRAG